MLAWMKHKLESRYPGEISIISEVLIPAYASSSPAFLMMYFAYELNIQGGNI